MSDIIKINQEKILNLKKAIKEKIKENKKLVRKEKNIKTQTNRYEQFFNKAYLSIWEEDPLEVYKFMDTLPCRSGTELKEYLSVHRETTMLLLRNLKVLSVNDYTVSLFASKNKTEFTKALDEGKILSKESIPVFYTIFSAMMDNKFYCEGEITTYTLTGKKLNLLMTAYLPGRNNGNILISMMDISERKHREDSLEYTVQKTAEQNKTNRVLQSTILSLSSSLDKTEILNSILTEVKKIIPYSCADIRLLEDNNLRVAVSTGYEDFNALDFIKNNSIKLDQFGDAEEYIKNGKIQILADTHNYPGWRIFKETSFIKSFIGLPIMWNNKTIGMLSLNSDKTGTYSTDDSENLKLFAHAASIALQNSDLYTQTIEENQKRIKSEALITKSLNEKRILLKEIHHRVKNNLSLIISLINLQRDIVISSTDSAIFEKLKQRIYAISLVHEKLYCSGNLANVYFKSYITDLSQSIMSSEIFNNNIDIIIDIKDKIEIEPDILVPLGLLINEILFNSVKHAFPEGQGLISITAESEKDFYKIILKDNGIGMSKSRNTTVNLSGLDLVDSLISQISGTITFLNNHGTISTITVPKK